MEAILYVESLVMLSLMESELNNLGIEYFVKKTDIDTLPSNLQKDYYAILFSKTENKEIILKIYENIKSGEILDEEELKAYENIELKKDKKIYTKKHIKNVWLNFAFVTMLGIILFQYLTYDKLMRSLNSRPSSIYEYKYSYNGTDVEEYLRKENKLIAKYIDRNQNGNDEYMEVYLPNGFTDIYIDENENSYFEIIRTYNGDELLVEYISTKDNGIFDITHYYKDGIIKSTMHYDEVNNIIWVE